jgi:hypothetical protein
MDTQGKTGLECMNGTALTSEVPWVRREMHTNPLFDL